MSSSIIPIPKAYFRANPDALKDFQKWQTENPDALQTDEALAQLEKAMANDNSGISKYLLRAVGDAGENGITRQQLLAVINNNDDGRRFTLRGMSGYLSLQGLQSDKKTDGMFSEKDGKIILSDVGEKAYTELEDEPATAREALPTAGGRKGGKKNK